MLVVLCDFGLLFLFPFNNKLRGYKKNSCSTQLSMNVFLLLNVKMQSTSGILIFMNRENNILSLLEPEN